MRNNTLFVHYAILLKERNRKAKETKERENKTM